MLAVVLCVVAAGAFAPQERALAPWKRTTSTRALAPRRRRHLAGAADPVELEVDGCAPKERPSASRRAALVAGLGGAWTTVGALGRAEAKCTDIESCREIGERKDEENEARNPTVRLADGVRYKELRGGKGPDIVEAGATIDIAYSISGAGGNYFYSRGFGFENDPKGGGKDVGDFYRVELGTGALPVGIERALVGMRRGATRRIELQPAMGFETSNWQPEPTSRRGKAQIKAYQQILNGNGSSQPPFPAETIWDVELRRIKK